ncbi:MAG: ABC transporter ATP-binding protein [Clostridia bacterium]|nr:ABC transporter ATP-binding protein [Clostridia bacterium]
MAKNKANKGTFARVLTYIKPQLFLVFLSLILSLVSVGLTIYVPMLIGQGIDLILGADNVDLDGVISILSSIAVWVAVTAIAQWFIGIVNNRLTFNVVRNIRVDAFRKIQGLPVSYIDSHGHGATVSRVIADVDTFSDGLLMGMTQLFSGLLTILGTLVFMLVLNYKITLMVVILTPGSILISKFIATRTFKLFREQAQAKEEQTSILEEVITAEKTVKAFGVEDRMIDKFDHANNRLTKVATGAVFYSSLVNPSTRFFNSVIYAAVVLTGAISAMSGGISVGMLTCFLGYVNQYTKPFNEISAVITEFQNALACADRIFALLDTPSEENMKDDESSTDVRGKVEFKNVKFSYVPEKPLIDNFDLEVTPGQMVAIVGPTGCGKTTLINLLMRFYDVNGGSIKLDGVDIRNMSRHDLRRNYGMVLQDTWIKHATVAENIALGKPDATMDEIISAAKAVYAHSFIKRLPKGYDTVIGDNGAELSGGQKQLISIARVMLCLPPVLILDEATSSIDVRTEGKIQAAFDKLTHGRTSFIVAHRLTTVRNADVIIVMKDGHVVESGDHESLLKKGGLYSHLYESQFVHAE